MYLPVAGVRFEKTSVPCTIRSIVPISTAVGEDWLCMTAQG